MNELDGFILVNKPAGISSARVVSRMKKLHGIRKIGHSGTLDPFATGLLVCSINRATRLSRFFLNGEKKYKGVLALGVDTDTQDSTGRVIKEANFNYLSSEDILKVVSKFKGIIYQTPPAFSALKHNGVPLYKLARKGIQVNKAPRRIFIHNLDICDINFPEISFDIHCSSGTYVRTVCADIGRSLGCGGHLKSLHRVASSNFSVSEAYELDYLESIGDNVGLSFCVLSMSESLSFMSSYIADQFLVKKIRNGVRLGPCDFVDAANSNTVFNFNGNFFKVIDSQGKLVAVLDGSDKSLLYNYCCVF